MSAYKSLMSPLKLGHVTLKNRIVSAAHAPGLAENGKPGMRYQLYHEEKAKGGLAMTMFGGSSNIARDSGSIYGQIYVGHDDIIPSFREFSDRIHKHGCAIMCQISHMGRRTSWNSGDWIPTLAPSVVRDSAHHSVPREMTSHDIKRIIKNFGDAAYRCQEGGLDGCEVLSSSHVLGQFLSPLSNRRTDAYGGELDRRARFLLEVLEEVKNRVSDDFLISVRFAADESNENGMPAEEGIEVARMIAKTGTVDFLNINGAYGATTHGLAECFPGMAYKSAPYIELCRQIKDASGLPVMQASRISDPSTADHAISEGYLDMAGMVRPLIADPHFAVKLERGEEERIRPCVGAGFCLDRVYHGGDVLCLQNAATAREQTIPYTPPKAKIRKKVVVVGGGPAGMEAARVLAERNHEVILFEAGTRLGGQICLAANATWRKDMIGIADWLAAEIEHLGVEVRLNKYAEKEDVLSEGPDVIIIATGGVPMQSLVEGGGDLALSSWDVLGGHAKVGGRVLVFDETGDHAGLSVAEHIANNGANVEIVTPDRQVGRAIGGQNFPVYLRDLYRLGVTFTTDHRVKKITQDGNQKRVTLHNDFTREPVERVVDHIILEQGTYPATELFEDLRDGSKNLGRIDVDALCELRPQPQEDNPKGSFNMFAIGDAVASRDIHAAIYDAMRLCLVI